MACGIAALLSLPAFAAGDLEWDYLADDVFQTLGRDAGLPDAVVGALTEDAAGFLWAGTQRGLARWDGYGFRVYRHDPARPRSLPSDIIEALYTDASGRLWLGTMTGDLARYDPATDGFVNFSPADGQTIWSIAEDQAGRLWVGADSGLHSVDPITGATETFVHRDGDPATVPDNRVLKVLVDRRGAIWVGTAGGLARSDDRGRHFQPVPLPAPAGAVDNILSLLQDADGDIWIGTATDGAFRIASDGTVAAVRESGAADSSFATSAVLAIAEIRTGEIWMAASAIGIVVLDKATMRTRRIGRGNALTQGLPSDDVENIYRGRAGQVWVGTGRGLSRYDSDARAILTISGGAAAAKGLAGHEAAALAAMPDGAIWAGIVGRGLAVIDPARGAVKLTDMADGEVFSHEIFAIASGLRGVRFLAGLHGLYCLPPGAPAIPLAIPNRDPFGQIDVLLADGSWLWAGSEKDGLWGLELPDGCAIRAAYRSANGHLSDARIQAIAPAGSPGALWVGTRDGLTRIDTRTGDSEHIAAAPSDPYALSDRFVSALLIDGLGRLWAGTYGAGVNVMTGRDDNGRPRFQRLGVAHGLPDPVVDAMAMDDSGRIWVSTDGGLAVIDPHTLAVRPMTRSDGLVIQSYWAKSVAKAADGALLFGGPGGLSVVRPDRLSDRADDPVVAFTDVRLGEGAAAAGSGARPVVVGPDKNAISAEFSALDYSAAGSTRYAYRLDGYDDHWIETDSRHRDATYTNLPPGNYTLRVRASNRFGAWAPAEAVLDVRVLPSWRQTVWFKVIVALALLACAWVVIRIRMHVLTDRQRLLELQVKERTAALDDSNRALAASVETLRVLGAVGREITANRELDSLFATLQRHAADLVCAARFTVFLINPATGKLIQSFTDSQYGGRSDDRAAAADPSFLARRAQAERRLINQSFPAADRADGVEGRLDALSVLAAPLMQDDAVVGVIVVESAPGRNYGEREELILGSLAAYGAVALANAQAVAALARARSLLEEFAYYDPLTSLPNRRSFLQSFHQAAVMARRQETAFALLLVDLDRLKLANDTFGHDAGDVLLVEAAARIKGAVREGDVVARVGGDEFAIILTDLESDVALEDICRRLVDAFAPAVAFKGGALETSPSIGIAIFPRDGDGEDAVYKAADLALFAAKRGGRNTWRWFHPDLAA